MRKLAFVPTGGSALRRGYPIFWSIIKDVVENWKQARVRDLNVPKKAKSPEIPPETLEHSADTERTSKETTFLDVRLEPLKSPGRRPEDITMERSLMPHTDTDVCPSRVPSLTSQLENLTQAEEIVSNTFREEIVAQLSSNTTISSFASPVRTSTPIFRPSLESPVPPNTTEIKAGEPLLEWILNAENTLVSSQTMPPGEVSLNSFHRRSDSGENHNLSRSNNSCDNGSMVNEIPDPEPVDSHLRWSISAGISDFSYGGDGGFGWDEDEAWPPVASTSDCMPAFSPIETGRANNTVFPSSPNFRDLLEAIEDEDDAPQSPYPSLSSFYESSVESTEGASQGEETGAITDDSVDDSESEVGGILPIGMRLPFDLSPTRNRAVALQIQSLLELTAKLLCARQNARATDWSKLWAIHPEDTLDDIISYYASFDGQVQAGLRLVLLNIRGENSSPSYKMCAYGCSKGGIHRWICNTMYV